ncbi:MAG: SGNH/GDSL hydrolase family protein [Clostridiales bacterium]|nr:SGNH/GDSL hydrolase family protein [Clostridiales bacterium]
MKKLFCLILTFLLGLSIVGLVACNNTTTAQASTPDDVDYLLTFQNVSAQTLGTSKTSISNEDVNALATMGTGSVKVVKEGNDSFVRIQSTTSDKYVGLRGFFVKETIPTTYNVTITLRTGSTSGEFGLQSGKDLSFRLLKSSQYKTQVLNDLIDYATADANGWKTIEFEFTPTINFSELRIFMYGTNNSYIDVKQVTIDDPFTNGDTPSEPNEAQTTVKLSDYVIVYDDEDIEKTVEALRADKVKAPISADAWAIYDNKELVINKLIAEEFASKVKESLGVTLTVKGDSEFTKVDKEIIIGDTNRNSYYANFENVSSPYDYKAGLIGNDLYMLGGTYATTYEAMNKLFDYLKENVKDGQITLNKGFKLEGTKDLKTIACIGDSISQGYTSTTKSEYIKIFSYSARLQRLHWKDTLVYNFGNPGKVMRNDKENGLAGRTNPYQETTQWKDCKAVKDDLDYVIISLGGNDSFYFKQAAWGEQGNQAFYDAFFIILDTLSENNKNIKFAFYNNLYNRRNDDNDPTNDEHCQDFIIELQANCVAQAQAKGYDINTIDMRSFTKPSNPNGSEIPAKYFDQDNLHLNFAGYEVMGDIINREITNMWWSTTPNTPNTPVEEKRGCGSVIGAESAILSTTLLAGAVIVATKKKKK